VEEELAEPLVEGDDLVEEGEVADAVVDPPAADEEEPEEPEETVPVGETPEPLAVLSVPTQLVDVPAWIGTALDCAVRPVLSVRSKPTLWPEAMSTVHVKLVPFC